MTRQAGGSLDQQLTAVLWDERLEDHVIMRAAESRNVKVQEALALARSEIGEVADLERALDSAAENAGGMRLEMVDPARWAPDLLRRIRGKKLPPPDDFYKLPESRPGSQSSS